MKPTDEQSGAQPPEEMTFEQAVEALEAIIEQIEQGEIGLEQSVTAYQRGIALIKRCRAVLGRAEQRIEQLTLDELEATNGDEPTD